MGVGGAEDRSVIAVGAEKGFEVHDDRAGGFQFREERQGGEGIAGAAAGGQFVRIDGCFGRDRGEDEGDSGGGEGFAPFGDDRQRRGRARFPELPFAGVDHIIAQEQPAGSIPLQGKTAGGLRFGGGDGSKAGVLSRRRTQQDQGNDTGAEEEKIHGAGRSGRE